MRLYILAAQLLQGVVGIWALLSLVALFAANGGTQLPLGVEGSRGAITAIMLVIVLPPAFVLGMSFPIIQRAIQDAPAEAVRHIPSTSKKRKRLGHARKQRPAMRCWGLLPWQR
jgi:hypothetical protein